MKRVVLRWYQIIVGAYKRTVGSKPATSDERMAPPPNPKIYHIVHLDRLASIINEGALLCDAEVAKRQALAGTTIGMSSIKARRLSLSVLCHNGLCVGDCVPFYFCPRSIMLFLIDRANHPELTYRGGQGPIIHLESDLRKTVAWAEQNNRKWAFTLSNAGAYYFESRRSLNELSEINWDAVQSTQWSGNGISRSVKEGKQAEFLIERSFPWELVERIGVISREAAQKVVTSLPTTGHRPSVEIRREWYY